CSWLCQLGLLKICDHEIHPYRSYSRVGADVGPPRVPVSKWKFCQTGLRAQPPRPISPLVTLRESEAFRPPEAWQESSSQRPSPHWVGRALARLAGSVMRFVSLRPTSRLSPPLREAPHLF